MLKKTENIAIVYGISIGRALTIEETTESHQTFRAYGETRNVSMDSGHIELIFAAIKLEISAQVYV